VSNSVLFLLAAVGLSVIGTCAVWLHGRPRRPKSSVDHFAQSLHALSMQRGRREAPSGVTPLPPRATRPVAATVPEPARRPRSPRPSAEGTRPGA
jgi:hypothetical protein